MKRLLSLLICVILVSSLFTACSGSEGGESAAVSESSKAEVSVEESAEEVSESEIDKILKNPDIYKGSDYVGRTFTIWTCYYTATHPSEFVYNEGEDEEIISETVNNAIAERNKKVEDAIGVEIKEIYYKGYDRYGGDGLNLVRDFVSSADPDIDCIDICLYDCGTLAMEDSLYDLYSLENIKMSNPWWEQYFNESVTIANQLYFTIGDVSLNSKGATPVVFYNMDLVEKLGLEDPFQLAIRGEWTVDKALEYSKAYVVDSADPVGKMDYNDEFGWAGQYDDMYAMLYGAGVRILSPGSDGYPTLSLNNETAISIVDKVITLMSDDSYISGNDYFGVSATPMVLLQEAFQEGRCIFYSGGIDNASVWDMEDEFGILPVPKFSNEQEEYYSLINTWTCNALCIGVNLDEDEAEFAAAVLDVMGYYSWSGYPDSVVNNYYVKMLKNQKLATENSEYILDLVFGARGCELGSIFQIGKINKSGGKTVNDMLIELMSSKTIGGFTSKYETYGGTFEADVETLVEKFKSAE